MDADDRLGFGMIRAMQAAGIQQTLIEEIEPIDHHAPVRFINEGRNASFAELQHVFQFESRETANAHGWGVGQGICVRNMLFERGIERWQSDLIQADE